MLGDWLEQTINPLAKRLSALGLSLSSAEISWIAIQLLATIICFLIATLIGRRLRPLLETRLEHFGRKPVLIRVLDAVRQSLVPIIFIVLLWFVLLLAKAAELTWQMRVFGIITSLASAWVIISIASRLIRNRMLSNLVAALAWLLAALNIVGILPQTLAILDGPALKFDSFRLSILTAIKAAVVVWILVWMAIVLGKFVERKLGGVQDLTPAMRVLISNVVKIGAIVLAVMIGLNFVGIDLTALTVFSGAIGLGLGFGLQKIVSNLISGIILLMDKSVKPGDVITVDDTFGTINAMGARYVSVIARDGREFLIPNEDLITNKVLNWSYSSDLVRLDLPFGTSYGADPHEVREIAKDTAKRHVRCDKDRAPVCHIVEFGDSSVNYLLRFWIRDPSGGVTNVRGDIYLALWDAFKANDIEIPFPHREILLRSPIEITTAPKPTDDG